MNLLIIILVLIFVILTYNNKKSIEGYRRWPYAMGYWPYKGLHPFRYWPRNVVPSYGFYSANGTFYYY